MTRAEAQKELMTGYISAGVGFVFGLIVASNGKDPVLLTAPLCAYGFWSIYWGCKIMYPLVAKYFDVQVSSGELWEALGARRTKMLWTLGITFFVGYWVGALGGAIHKQVTLMQVT
jgi:hypothetical protein